MSNHVVFVVTNNFKQYNLITCSGLKTALVEKYDYASGTSSKSTKLIHGGVRYLQKAIMKLDREQVIKKIFLLQFPQILHCTKRLTFWTYYYPDLQAGIIYFAIAKGSSPNFPSNIKQI